MPNSTIHNSLRWIIEPAIQPLDGAVGLPGDKSISHRSILFAALSEGCSEIGGLSDGQDCQRTLTAMTQLGARFEKLALTGSYTVQGIGVDRLAQPTSMIDCGNSGTSIRLLSGLLAGQSFVSHLGGDDSLAVRPMNRVAIPLRQMGATIDGGAGPDPANIYPPLQVAGGKLSAINYRSPIASAQVKSAILLAGLYAEGITSITEPKQSRDHTERMLAQLGVPIVVHEHDRVVRLDPSGWNRKIEATRFDVPGDPSSAAFVLIAALVAGAKHVVAESVCTNPTRTGFFDVLSAMGAPLSIETIGASTEAEPSANIHITSADKGQLVSTIVEGELTVRAIDELPILAVAAAVATGTTEIRDASELRVKESDRIATTAAMLRALGVEVIEKKDGLIIQGRGGAPLTAGRVDAAGDHRIAMAAAVAGLAADGPVVVDDVANVSTSFPRFVELITGLGARISIHCL